MSCTRSQFVAQLQSWVGLKESNGTHKKIIDLYNTLDPLPVGYKLKYADAWCAGTVSAGAQACKATDIIPTECSCPRMITKAQKMGIWVEADNYKPQPGDIVMYDFDDSGKGDNKGGADHVGVVEKISGSTITVIEGNYSNAVKRRKLQVNGRYIRGYIVPKFDAEEVAAPEVKEEKKEEVFTLKMRILSKGCKGDDVRALQILLKGHGYNCGAVDGIFGINTDSKVRKYQKDHGLVEDGEAGPDTMSSMLGL